MTSTPANAGTFPTGEAPPATGRAPAPAEPVDQPRTYVGAYALCVRDGRVLLARLVSGGADAGMWVLPGGGLNWGEDPAVGVLRELEEETGLSGTIAGIAGVYSRTYLRSAERPRDSVHHLGILFDVEAHDGDLRHEANGSTDHCAWIPLAEVDALPLVPLVRFALPLLRR